MIKKTIAVAAALVMALTLIPAAVFADSGRTPVSASAYYGRSALADMSNSTALLYAYDKLKTAVSHNGETVNIYDGYHPISETEMETVIDAYRRDYVEHFWIGNDYSYSFNSTTILSITPTYLTSNTQNKTLKAQLEARADEILGAITPEMTDFEVELLIHDSIVNSVTYAESANCRSAYGALVEGVAVCEGYAEAFQYLCRKAGIESFTAIGRAGGEGHEWSYAKLGGSWYHVDVTWDDQSAVSYAYFNRTTSVITRDHSINSTAYALPVCTSTEAFYYNVMPGALTSFDVSTVAGMLVDGDLSARFYVESGVDSFMSWFQTNIRAIASAAGISGAFGYSWCNNGNETLITLTATSVRVQGVTLSPASLELEIGETASLTAAVRPSSATNGTVYFSSSDLSVATVDDDGKVTAVGAGEATIVVLTDEGGFTAVCEVTVLAPAPAYVYGDANGDGGIDTSDVTLIRRYLANFDYDTQTSTVDLSEGADANGDGEVSTQDVTLLRRYLANFDYDTGTSTVTLGPQD